MPTRKPPRPPSVVTPPIADGVIADKPPVSADIDLRPGGLTLPEALDPEEIERRQRAEENFRQIRHVVVMMLENRSFDHLLGYLSLPPALGGRGRADVEGLTGAEFNVAEGRRYDVRRLTDPFFPVGPPHSHGAILDQLGLRPFTDGPQGEVLGLNKGFARSFLDDLRRDGHDFDPGLIMGYYTADNVPMFDFLAREFTVCDHWFSSFPGPTWPNRMFLYAGTSNGITGNPSSVLAPYAFSDPREMPSRLLTDVLDQHGVEWKSYSDDFAWIRFFPGRQSGVLANNIQDMRRFRRDCEKGRLPSFAFVDPNFTDLGPDRNSTDDLPPCDVRQAQRGVREVYEALRQSPNWPHTLFVVTYDEHGGFHDHLPPAPVFDERQGFFRVLGARVPALVASPYVPRGSVAKTVFDHTSVARTVLQRFVPAGPNAPFLSLRERMARSLSGLLTAESPRFDAPAAPSVPPPARRAPLPQSALAQMAAALRTRATAATP